MRILTSACLYFLIVFGVGLLLGPVLVLWLEPSLGKTAAVAVEAPFLLTAIIFAARHVPKWTGLHTTAGSLTAMGIGALVLQQIADFAVAIGLRGMTAGEQIASLAEPAGLIYVALVILFAAMPVLVHLRR
jgi:hypothetical protein